MIFFKQMYLKKKKKLDNKGVALANVLLITTFVMVITSSVLSMAYNTYRMKLINVSAKDNLYACEAVLEQVRVGFRNQFSEITDELDEITSETLVTAFRQFYSEYKIEDESILVDTLNSVSGSNTYGIYYYDVVEVAKLLTSITGTNGAKIVVDEDNATRKLEYNGSTPVFTSSVDITVADSDYENIKLTLQANATGKNNFELTDTSVTFHDLTVIYSENGYESEVTTDITIEFPEVGSTTVKTTGGGQNGLVGLDDRINTYGYWTEYFTTNPDSDFGVVYDTDPDTVYLNTTDYPANSISYIIFDMARYNITSGYGIVAAYDGSGYSGTYYWYDPVIPKVQVQNGSGAGEQYDACGTTGYDNVEIYVGPDTETEEELEDVNNWVAFYDVFDDNYYVKTDDRDDPTSAVAKYIAKYGDEIVAKNYYIDDGSKNVTIKYRVYLIDPNGYQNSRGWIAITDLRGTETYPDIASGVYVYVDIGDEYNEPLYYFKDIYGNTSTTDIYGTGYIYFDLRKCNYYVGDTLKITIKNIDVDKILSNEYFNVYMEAGSEFDYNDGTAYKAYNNYSAITVDYTYETGDDYITISIPMRWNYYPFLCISMVEDWSGYSTDVEISTEWEAGSGTTITTTTGTATDAVIYYEDWRKE